MTVSEVTPTVDAGGTFAAHLHAFLDRLSASMVGRLYETPASCLSIFRLLPETSRHIALGVLWSDAGMRLTDVALWVRDRKSDGSQVGQRKHLRDSIEALRKLHIITGDDVVAALATLSTAAQTIPDSVTLTLDSKFTRNLRLALTGGGAHGSFGTPSNETDIGVDVKMLDSYAESRWEMIQHFMVASGLGGIARPSDNVLHLLLRSGLMSSPNGSLQQMSITSRGFQFLLEDVNTQLWDLLLHYLTEATDIVRVLGFLFMLGSMVLGRCYSTEHFSEDDYSLLSDLSNYGLVYMPAPKNTHFYPTRLATTLTSSAAPLVSSRHQDEEQGFVVLETNFKVYAYTSNPLQIAVLSLFIHLKTRLPNFVTGQITRDSIKRGLANGITADQIVSYLTTRAHPQMRADAIKECNASVIPTTVIDQIRLWQQEGQRVRSEDGYLYTDFSAQADYELVADYARDLGVILWQSSSARRLFVTMAGHLQVREFIKRRMAAAAAGQ
ncbi:RNA polymerase II transcription factor B 52 kDa subunit [Microbotryomycetes sp. JL201]|nr:RNA polymerase II transcription factor B 52 kDa subunit [Microbotryomycetes sp. JL201]